MKQYKGKPLPEFELTPPPEKKTVKKKAKQLPLFTDKDVRRDYFASCQWVEQHVVIKKHITGYAVCYEQSGGAHRPKDPKRTPIEGRAQGSLYSQQKHAIADAVEWIRQNSRYKPRIFVATTPGFIEAAKEGAYISKLVKNLTNGYGMNNYVWVREATKKGFPHYHFVADIDEFNPVKLSLYWSNLFLSNSKNSVRLGTKPDAQGRRKFWIENNRMAWYMSKYIGKDISAKGDDGKIIRRKYRTFAISEQAALNSQPLVYNSYIKQQLTGLSDRKFLRDNTGEIDLALSSGVAGGNLAEDTLNPRSFSWRWTGHGNTFVGFVKK